MRYNKLVRDRIPEIIERSGKKPIYRIIKDEDEYKRYLEKKLDEEVKEFHDSKSIDEIVDIIEVVTALATVYGHSTHDITRRRAIKIADRGKFNNRILLLKVKKLK